MNTSDTVNHIIRKHLKREAIPAGATFGSLGADSLDVVEIAMAIEMEFGLSTSAFDDWGFDTTVAAAIADLEREVAREREPA